MNGRLSHRRRNRDEEEEAAVAGDCERGLTVNERKEEKRVPSSYLEILASTPSRMATNWGTEQTVAPMKAVLLVQLQTSPTFETFNAFLSQSHSRHDEP